MVNASDVIILYYHCKKFDMLLFLQYSSVFEVVFIFENTFIMLLNPKKV